MSRFKTAGIAVILGAAVAGAGVATTASVVGEIKPVAQLTGPELVAEFSRLAGSPAALAKVRAEVAAGDTANRDRLSAIRTAFMKLLDDSAAKSPVPVPAESKLANDASWGMLFDPTLISLGDPSATQIAETLAKSDDANHAAVGKVRLLAGKWIAATTEADQNSAADELAAALTGKDVTNAYLGDTVTRVLGLRPGKGNAREYLCSKIAAAYPSANVTRAEKSRIAQAARDKVTAAFEGQPITIAGTKPDGTPFSTKDWQGKVILVDFWATWCGPCKAELPRVKELYTKYHGQGLEIVSVSNDYTKDALVKYLANDTAMAWPNIFDEEAAGKKQWHPVTGKFGINSIPRVFLIDRKGVLRTVEAREQMEDLVPKLLAETE